MAAPTQVPVAAETQLVPLALGPLARFHVFQIAVWVYASASPLPSKTLWQPIRIVLVKVPRRSQKHNPSTFTVRRARVLLRVSYLISHPHILTISYCHILNLTAWGVSEEGGFYPHHQIGLVLLELLIETILTILTYLLYLWD